MALSASGLRTPYVLYASGTLRRVTPDSSVNEGIIAIDWSGMRLANGFSGCEEILSANDDQQIEFVIAGKVSHRIS